MDVGIPVWILCGLSVSFILCISVCFAVVRLCYLLSDKGQGYANMPTTSNTTGETDHTVADVISHRHRAAALALSGTSQQQNEQI